jgi:GT2 family glycosyltransferase
MADRPAVVVAIMLTWNQRDKTIRCIESFCESPDPPDHLMVWDNGSVDGTADAIRDHYPLVFVHRHPVNLGVASGRNAAAELAIRTFAPSHLLFIDNDMVVTPAFSRALLAPFLSGDDRLAQTSAKIRMMREPERLDAVGGCNVQFWLGQTTPIGNGEIDRGQYDRPMRCIAYGGATLFRADVFQALGGFDGIFDPYGPEDLDFSLRARKAGYYALYVPEAEVLHEGSKTASGGQYSEKYLKLKVRHWFTFMRRHATLPQRLAFYVVGGPYTLARMVIRESRKGNAGALRGLIGGLTALRSRRQPGSR